MKTSRKIGGSTRLSRIERLEKLIHPLLFGTINAIMCVPVMISFTSIIFQDQAFREVLPSLIKIMLFSCMIHQICFTVFSGLTFAVGQVQDAGLIFLSAMATSIVSGCKSPDSVVPTTLVVLSVYTALLGVMLILMGKMKLASMVQYLPLPVIGGYLAYIGFFCGQAGLAMMAGVEISTPSDWSKLLNRKSLMLILPGLSLGCGQYVMLRTVKSSFTLPVCMATVLIVFYASLATIGISLQEGREYGWIAELAPEIPFYRAWDLFRFDQVDVSLILPQFPKFVAMVLVVAFSSSLDVAAIEMELGLPLDYNRELQTVGISNLFSGVMGGYTGSYIFSQTLFSLRRGVKSRVAGAMLAVVELAIIAMPISVTSYLPKMFFGSMLVLISTDLMWEWLVMAAAKMMAVEYAVCVATFLAIMLFGIETGMALGVLLSIISFVVVYAKLSSLTSSHLLLRSSTVVRSYEERRALLCKANRGKIVTISLKGYVFFGSAVKILEEVKSKVILTPSATDSSTLSFSCTEGRSGSDELSELNGDNSTHIQCQAPMFSFQMNRVNASEKKNTAIAHNMETLGSAKEREQTKSVTKEIDAFSHKKAHEMAYVPMAASSSSSSDNTNTQFKSVNSLTSYSPLQMMSAKSRGDDDRSQSYHTISHFAPRGFTDEEDEGDGEVGDDEDGDDGEGEGQDKEKGSEIDDGHTETSGNSDESKSKHRKSARKGRGKGSGSSKCLPPKSRAIPLVRATSNSHNPMGQGQGGVETQRDTSNYLIAGSPLQSMSAYNLDQDQLSSYQKRWIHDRDRDRDLVGSISRSGSAQSLPHSAQKSSSPAPHAPAALNFVSMNTSAPAPASSGLLESRDVRSLQDVEDARGSEEGTIQSRPETYKDLVSSSRDRTQPTSLPLSNSSSSSSSATYRRSSNLSSNLAKSIDSADSEKESPSDEGQGQGRYNVFVGEQQQHPPLLSRTATRTKSMSQLLSSASSLNPNSILSAVWSSQERRRERVKLLAAGEKATNGDGDRRSKSYNSLSAACIPIIAESSTLKDIHALLEMEESKRNDLTSRTQRFDSPKRTHPHGRGAATGLFDGRDHDHVTNADANANTDLEPTEYLILDFTEVLGVDATSARSCFLMLVQLMRSSGVKVVFAAMSPGIESLLGAHGVIRRSAVQGPNRDFEDADIVIATADEALEWCENRILLGAGCGRNGSTANFIGDANGRGRENGMMSSSSFSYPSPSPYPSSSSCSSSSSLWGLRRILRNHLEIEEQEEEEEKEEEGSDKPIDHGLVPSPQSILNPVTLGIYFKREEVPEGEVVFDVGHRAHKVYFIEEGSVEILLVPEVPVPPGPKGLGVTGGNGKGTGKRAERVNKISSGGIFGEAAFFMDLPQSVRCVSLSKKCVLWTLDRDSYLRMEISHPSLCLLVQHTLLKSLSITSTSSLHALHPSAAYSIMFE